MSIDRRGIREISIHHWRISLKNSKSEVDQFEDAFAGGEWEAFESQFRRNVVELIPEYLIPFDLV